ARRTARHAGHASEAAVEMLGHGGAQRERALRRLLHQLDPPARRDHLLAPEDVRRAGREAEPAVDARPRELLDHVSTPSGSSRAFSARWRPRAAAGGTPPTRCGTYAMPAAGRTTASVRVDRTVATSLRRNARTPRAT